MGVSENRGYVFGGTEKRFRLYWGIKNVLGNTHVKIVIWDVPPYTNSPQ